MHTCASVYLPRPFSHSTLQHSQQQACALEICYVCFIYIDFPRSFYFTEYEILTAVCQVSDSTTKLWESPFWDQGQCDTKDIIGHFNSATVVEQRVMLCFGLLAKLTAPPPNKNPLLSFSLSLIYPLLGLLLLTLTP
jgi:hypothetical protein